MAEARETDAAAVEHHRTQPDDAQSAAQYDRQQWRETDGARILAPQPGGLTQKNTRKGVTEPISDLSISMVVSSG